MPPPPVNGLAFSAPRIATRCDEWPSPVDDDDIARGWRVWEVKTNAAVDYAMPEGATLASNWWVRGAYEDVKRFDFDGWRFPFGTNEYDSAWAFSWGKLRLALGDAASEIVAVGSPMAAVPYHSRLWTAVGTNGSRFVTWENFALGRDTNAPVNAQIELRTTGDFVTRSNAVETVCLRVDPEDWDGDGWQNDDDPDPCNADEFSEEFCQELPPGANEAAYCWIEIRPRWNSWIEFYGDAPSDLEDPCFWAKAGETYCVMLLIGKTYAVECSREVEVVGRSDARIEVTDVEPNAFTVVWPVGFTVAEGRAPEARPRLGATWNAGGKSFYVLPEPLWLGGRIAWSDDYCCGVWGDGTNFTYACDNTCTCEGCTVYGSYWYEGYALPVWGVSCGCRYVDDRGPSEVLAFGFDKAAAIYEDEYTNMPGVVVRPAPSNVVLRCEVYGGTYGGRLTVALNDAGRRKIARVRGDELPTGAQIPPGATRVFETEYTPLEPSGKVGDIVAVAVFCEDFLDVVHSNDTSMTSVKVELMADKIALLNTCRQRHTYGVGETVSFANYPSDVDLSWEIIMNGEPAVMAVDYTNVFYCSWSNANGVATVTMDGVSYSTQLTVVEPEIEVRNICANDRFSAEAKMWDPTLVDVNPVVGEAGHLFRHQMGRSESTSLSIGRSATRLGWSGLMAVCR